MSNIPLFLPVCWGREADLVDLRSQIKVLLHDEDGDVVLVSRPRLVVEVISRISVPRELGVNPGAQFNKNFETWVQNWVQNLDKVLDNFSTRALQPKTSHKTSFKHDLAGLWTRFWDEMKMSIELHPWLRRPSSLGRRWPRSLAWCPSRRTSPTGCSRPFHCRRNGKSWIDFNVTSTVGTQCVGRLLHRKSYDPFPVGQPAYEHCIF